MPQTPLIWGPHLDAICEHLDAVYKGQIQNLIITTPPGSTKSNSVCVYWPAWCWIGRPWWQFLCASSDAALTLRDAVASRRLMTSEWYQERFGHCFSFTSDQNIKGWYENDKRGFRTSTSVGADVIGKKGDVLLGDDLLDALKAKSKASREAAREWFGRGFWNRVNDERTCRRVMPGQRVHDEDVVNFALESGKWVELRLAEEYNPRKHCSTCIGWQDWRTEKGELLRPQQFGPDQVEAARKILGASDYSAQHQQDPTPEEGNLFKAANFRYYLPLEISNGGVAKGHEECLPRFQLGPSVIVAKKDCIRFATVDLAVSVKEEADSTAILSWLLHPPSRNLLLVGLVCERMEAPDILPRVQREIDTWNLQWVGVEKVGYQLAIIQYARRMGMQVRELQVSKKEDKIARAQVALVMMEAGQVWFPSNAPWLGECVSQLLAFPKGRHDDVVDGVSYGCQEAAKILNQYAQSAMPLSLGPGKFDPWHPERSVGQEAVKLRQGSHGDAKVGNGPQIGFGVIK